MSFSILGMGTAVPETRVPQSVAKEVARVLCCESTEDESWLSMMYDHTGIEARHQVLGGDLVRDLLDGTRHSESIFLPSNNGVSGPTTQQRMQSYVREALPLGLRASQSALAEAKVAPSEITHLVTVSCTGFAAPGLDIDLIQELGLPPTTERTNVGFMGCHGAFNGLRVARGLTASEPEARVLLCAVELCSIHYSYGWDPQRIIGNALFADGAAALVGTADAGDSSSIWKATASGSCVVPNTKDAMAWTISDHGFVMTLSKRIPRIIEAHLRPWLEAWLSDNGLSIQRVASWAIHPGGPAILDAAESALGMSTGSAWASREIFGEYGNMSSPTILFILERLHKKSAPRPCVALGFGPGLTIEAALLT